MHVWFWFWKPVFCHCGSIATTIPFPTCSRAYHIDRLHERMPPQVKENHRCRKTGDVKAALFPASTNLPKY